MNLNERASCAVLTQVTHGEELQYIVYIAHKADRLTAHC